MALMKAKGTIFKWTISSVLTAVPQIESISTSGQGTITTPVLLLDGAVGEVHFATGFANVAKIAIKMMFDAANSVHVALKAASVAPATTACTITYTDAGPVTDTYSATGVGLDMSIEGSKPVEATLNIQTSGIPT